MTFNNAHWKAKFTDIASNTNAAIMVPKIKVENHQKRQLVAKQPTMLCVHEPIADANTDVARGQRAANCLEEAVWSCTSLWTKSISVRANVISHRPVQSHFFKLPGYRLSNASKLAWL
ncbi:hypothetical protein TNCV_4756351 [Trichonephila clavipes]|nr:hypothetical protein TNCV_4756351 [Trichonephila clavipes]